MAAGNVSVGPVILIREWHRCRFLWNEAVHQLETGRKPNFAKLGKLLAEARTQSSWLRGGSPVAQQQMIRTFAQALDASFTVKGHGRPRYKSRKKTLSRDLPSEPSSVRITRDSLGRWYASFVVTRERQPVPITDEEFDLPHAQHRTRCAAELAKSQKRMARRPRGKGQAPSKGYRQARKQAADAAIATMKRELVERGRRAGRKVVLVRPAYTTMTCSRCFARANPSNSGNESSYAGRAGIPHVGIGTLPE